MHALRASARHLETESLKLNAPAGPLLLFYALECAMKAEILRRYGVRSWDELEGSLRTKFGHDLDVIARHLNLAPEAIAGLRECRMKNDLGRQVSARRIHEVWRYGGRLEPTDQVRFVEGLRRLVANVKGHRA
jgi:hypothetical protein